MELGPLQTKWVKSLRENPERQISGRLGLLDPNTKKYGACCLGEAALVCGIGKWDGLILKVHYLTTNTDSSGVKITHPDSSVNFLLGDTYKVIGLNSGMGTPMITPPNKSLIIDGKLLQDLSHMNDGNVSWPDIADHIEKYSDYYFTHPV